MEKMNAGRLFLVVAISVIMVSISGCVGSHGTVGSPTHPPSLTSSTSEHRTVSSLKDNLLSFYVYGQECQVVKEQLEHTFKASNVTCKNIRSSELKALYRYTGNVGRSFVAVTYKGSLRAVIGGNLSRYLRKSIIYSIVGNAESSKGIVVRRGNNTKLIMGNVAFYVSSILLLGIIPSKLHFYMYGEHTCPHCRDMLRWIPMIYGRDSLTFYDLIKNVSNRKMFSDLYRLLGVTGVPIIGVTYNGTLRAVINSEYNASATPSIVRSAIDNNGVLVYLGKWYILYYNRNSTRVLINALYKIFVDHESVNTTEVLKEAKEANVTNKK